MDVLFRNFYQMNQERGEKVQTFMAQLEESLNRLRLRYPSMVTEADINRQLKEWLFYRMNKLLRDSI